VTVYNGIDGEIFKDSFSIEEKSKIKESLRIREDEFIAAIVASLRQKKGHEHAFKAVKAIARAGDKVRLLILGDGERKIFLQKCAEQLSVSRNLVWLGYQNDPRKFLSVSDALIVPSIAESFPISILEALAMGKPVIASRVGGIPEVISDGLNGFLFEPKDVLSLVEKLQKLIRDKALKKELSQNARESMISKFSISEMVGKIETLFVYLFKQERHFDVYNIH
jgi:glycosyltransferase involved in cell wall biosynthesis